MRVAVLILAVFCALISGWTAALARTQGIEGMATVHDAVHPAGAAAGHTATGIADQCAAEADRCDHPSHPVHPLLCAACFAVMLSNPDLDREELAAPRIRPLPQKPMQAVVPEPLFPPPKTFVPIS